MASRKKKPETMSLFGALPSAPTETTPSEPTGGVRDLSTPEIAKKAAPTASPAMGRPDDPPACDVGAAASPDVQGGERPRLRVVPQPAATPESEVIVEPTPDGSYVVSLLRHHGTTVAAVKYSRAQLMQLIARAHVALEVG